MRLVEWIRRHDPAFAALRRATRGALVIPLVFAFGSEVIADPQVATFAAFGSFSLLLLVDFGGPMRERLQAYVALALVGAGLISLGTICSRSTVLAAAAMAVVAFCVIFAGVVSSTLAGASTALLLLFILPVSLTAPASAIPARLEGFAIAAAAAIAAVAVLWPAPARDPLRATAIGACRAMAARLRADAAWVLGGGTELDTAAREAAIEKGDAALSALRKAFYATPYRPTGLSTAARSVVRLVDELLWLQAIVGRTRVPPSISAVNRGACHVKRAAAGALEQSAALLEAPHSTAGLEAAIAELRTQVAETERTTSLDEPPAGGTDAHRRLVSALDPAFRAQELSFAVSQVAANASYAAAADRRGWMDRLLGRRPDGIPGTLSAAGERAAAHVDRQSVWLHNSVRGAIGLAVAVLVASTTHVDHSFWVILGALSVLRSNALATGETVLRALAGTLVGFVAGALLVAVIGTDPSVLWPLLPVAILFAGFAPTAISFAAGQAAFTVVLVILFNIVQPTGWTVGLVRIEDVALGCLVSAVVGLLFWPRGASAALRRALADAYRESARYVVTAVELGVSGDESPGPGVPAAAAARRLDDAFRGFMAERGTKLIPLSDVATLVTGVVGLRLAGDAILDLWRRDGAVSVLERDAAVGELRAEALAVAGWYDALAAGIVGEGELPEPLHHDGPSEERLVEAAREGVAPDDRTAIRIVWTSDHLDAVRRLQRSLREPAQHAEEARRRSSGLGGLLPLRRVATPA